MKLKLEVEPKSHPNQVGELLRNEFFAGKLSAYNCFEWSSAVSKLADEAVEDDYGMDYKCAEKEINGVKVKCRWFADGDTTLQFVFSDGSVLENDDAKKVYCWRFWTKAEYEARWENSEVMEMIDVDESKLIEMVE